jgi:hypothetical protein
MIREDGNIHFIHIKLIPLCDMSTGAKWQGGLNEQKPGMPLTFEIFNENLDGMFL